MCKSSRLATLTLAVVTPLAAQQGRDLLHEQFVKEAAGGVVVYEAGDISLLVDAISSDPAGVASAATTEYKYDDGTFEIWTHLRHSSGDPVHEQEYAQRFRLSRGGTVANLTLCVARDRDRGDSSRLPFAMNFYRDSAGRPGSRLASGEGTVTIPTAGSGGCARLDLSSSALRLDGGDTWVGISWQNSTGMLFGEDRDGPGGTRTVYRARSSSTAAWPSWTNDTVTYGIRLGVDHGGGTPPPPPPPDPDPDPPPTSSCTPTTTALQFDGGYKVSMCYGTPDGKVGQAKSGVWQSGEAGLLWFFNRGNAEVLVKVLNGCSNNGYRWAYVAPVTTLEFNLWVTGPNGRRWTHSNRQGVTASTKSSTTAFRCSDEGSDGGDDDGDDGVSAPDLVVQSPSVSDTSLTAGQSFTFRATVRNRGDARSASTTLRYYRSSNSTIGTSEENVDSVGSFAVEASEVLPATSGCTPTTTALQFDGGYKVSMCYGTPDGKVGQAKSGVWQSGEAGLLWFFNRGNAEVLVKVLNGCSNNGYRWAYVAPVTTLEFNLWVTGPNGRRWTHSNRQGVTASTKSSTTAFRCSDEGSDGGDDDGDDGVSAPDLVVQSPSVSDTSLTAGQSFTFRATVRNRGDARSASTTLRYYRSSNSTIGTSDTQIGTDSVGALSASGSSSESISLTAPSSAGTYYYGACVESVPGESNTNNNCSAGVRVTVSGGTGGPAVAGTVTACEGDLLSSGDFRMRIAGTVRAARPVRDLTLTGFVEPGRRRVGERFVGSLAAGQSRSYEISGTVSGVEPTRCEVRGQWREGANATSRWSVEAPVQLSTQEP